MGDERRSKGFGEIASHLPTDERDTLIAQWAGNHVRMKQIDNAPFEVDRLIDRINTARGSGERLDIDALRKLISPTMAQDDLEDMQRRWEEKDKLQKETDELARKIVGLGAKSLPDKLSSASAAIGAVTVAGMTGLFYLATVGPSSGLPNYAKSALWWGAIGTLLAAVPRLPPLFAAFMDWLRHGRKPPSMFGLRRWIVWIELACLVAQIATLVAVAVGVLHALR